MKKLKYQLFKRRLNKDNIIIDDNDLNRVIEIYDYLINFVLDYSKETGGYPYGFVITPKKLFKIDDTYYYDIFRYLIYLYNNNLLNYLDYSFIIDCSSLERTCVEGLSDYTRKIAKYHKIYGDNFIYRYYEENECVIESVIHNHLEKIDKSKYISDHYKEIINLFYDLFDNYDDIDYEVLEDCNYEIYIDEYLNAIYYYLVKNDLIINDYENVYNFLSNINNDIMGTMDKMNLVGIDSDEDLFNYIDNQYKNSKNKVKEIK